MASIICFYAICLCFLLVLLQFQFAHKVPTPFIDISGIKFYQTKRSLLLRRKLTGVKKCRFGLMRLTIFRKNKQDAQINQTTVTANTNYIQNPICI